MAEVWAGYTPEERARRCAAISERKREGWAARKAPRGACKVCAKLVNPGRKYCSRACMYADPDRSWRKGPPKLPRRLCLTCGKENLHPRDKYCSRECCRADPRHDEIHLPGLLRGQKKSAQPEIRERAAARMRGRAQTALLTAKGPAHARAIAFCLRSPDGRIYSGRNVLHFVRTHKALFDPQDLAWGRKKRGTSKRLAHPQCRASKGLANLFGESEFVRYSWKGWTRVIKKP
jgi:predicted nucleic acid-binding Zn ribbon protein